jgi:hypothetical protein
MSVLKTANVHFDASGLVRIGKDGSNIVIKTNGGSVDIEGLDVAGQVAPAFNQANTARNHANAAFLAANNAVTDYSPAFNQANTARTQANIAYAQANAAYDAANNAGGALTLTDDSVDATRYVTFSDASSGDWTNANVSSTKLYFNPSTGTLNATVFNSLSDKDKKDNIEVIPNALELIDQLNGVRFNWKETGEPSAGIIAQDLQKIMPELVGEDMSVNYAGVIGLLVQCIKELKEK